MTRGAVTGALAGALLGAAGWGAVTWFSGYEIGIVAWAVGGLVGLLAYLGGGKGTCSGLMCAALALLAIFGGKMLAMEMVIRGEIKDEYTLEAYQWEMEAAQALPDYEGNHPAFEEWLEEETASASSEVSVFGLVRENMGLLDIVFAALGVITALRVGSRFEAGG